MPRNECVGFLTLEEKTFWEIMAVHGNFQQWSRHNLEEWETGGTFDDIPHVPQSRSDLSLNDKIDPFFQLQDVISS